MAQSNKNSGVGKTPMPKKLAKAPKGHPHDPDGSGTRPARGDNMGAPPDKADQRWYGGGGGVGASGSAGGTG
jgi:hypothetical protein